MVSSASNPRNCKLPLTGTLLKILGNTAVISSEAKAKIANLNDMLCACTLGGMVNTGKIGDNAMKIANVENQFVSVIFKVVASLEFESRLYPF